MTLRRCAGGKAVVFHKRAGGQVSFVSLVVLDVGRCCVAVCTSKARCCGAGLADAAHTVNDGDGWCGALVGTT